MTPFFAMVNAAISDKNLIRKMSSEPSEMWDFLHEFYECFSKTKAVKFSKRKAIGLWGELSKIKQGEITDEILDSWRGPENYVHDFICENIAIDIKTTTGKNRNHKINHDQLFDKSSSEIYIESHMITKNYSSGKSVDSIVEEICEELSPKSRFTFVKKLGMIGYNHKEEHFECGVKYSPRSGSRLFSASSIPHIKQEHIPVGIMSIEYTITLDNLEPLTDEVSIN